MHRESFMRRICSVGAILILILVTFTGVIFAEKIDSSMAQQVGTVQLRVRKQIRFTQALTPVEYSIQTVRLLEDTDTGETLAYILDLEPKGFVAISSDTDIRPVIAYSYYSNFSMEDLEHNVLLYMLKKDMRNRLNAISLIDQAIKRLNNQLWEEYLSEGKSPALVLELADADQWPDDDTGWLDTTWEQTGFYDNSCPKDPISIWGSRCVVGCTAVAMGQIINYWQYPDSMSFDSSDEYVSERDGRVINIDADHEILDFPSFDELNISLANISYSGDMSEIADFLFACGIAVQMKYSDEVSGAWVYRPWEDMDAQRALKNKFGYHANGKEESDDFYDVLENNMKGGQPALLTIYKDNYEGGHAIVADGFRSTGEYHLNFGWGSEIFHPISEAWYFLPTGMRSGYTIVARGVLDIHPNTPPNTPRAPAGPDSVTPSTSYDFTATTTDPDGDQVAFKFDWGDGSESDWTDFVDSGASVSASHSWANDGTYEVKAKAKDINNAESGWSESHTIVINNPPNTPLAPTGPDSGSPDTPYYFAAATFDPDGDQVCYKFDWGDGSESNWTSFVDSGSAAGEYHSWSSKGIYEAKVKAKDANEAESGWSEAHTIIINNPPNIPSAPSGPDSGTPGTSYDFTATTTDPDGDQVAFKFDWGDGSECDWTSFVASGASTSASHSWANDGTYQVKAKAKDSNDAESGWSETHQIVTSRPDLTVTSISPDAASIDQQVDIIVTVANEGAQDVTQDFYVDVYYDPSSPPDKGQYGDERQQITQTVQAGGSSEVTFTYTFDSSRDHEVWAQADTSDFVSETDEDNNIYGPHTVAVSERRHENETFSLPAGKWKMISIPFTSDDPSPNAVLVDDLGTQNDAVWKLYRWNTANESYDKYPNVDDFSPGKSFWIISEDAKTVDTGPGTDVSRQTDFVINLPSGWTQIGNPFPFSINWDEVRVKRNAEVVSILEAQARGWVRDKIWYWDGQSYLVYQAPSGTIDPYEGYWAKALLDCELLIPPDEAQGENVSGQTVNSKEEFLQLKAKVGEFEDNFNFLGFSESAKDGYDRLDIEEAPPISPYVSLFFPHPEWEKNKGDYTQDIRTRSFQAGLTWFWDFQVKTDQLKKEIILEWENTLAISEELYLYLTDSLSNVLADMKEKNSYGFSPSNELESFKIIATYEALPLPEDLNLTEVYGYPNPAHGAGAKFHFHLASWAKVTIKIYTISGELVRTLVEDKVFLPGAYEEPWEEKNDKGEKLARGVYIFIVQAGNPAKVISKSGKIALLD